MNEYFLNFEAIHQSCLIKILTGNKLPRNAIIWELKNELKPADLFSYLYAKYGQPNGIQNLLRNDSSDNLIHWEWSLANKHGIIQVQGHNFRTEVHLIGEYEEQSLSLDMFVKQIKSDFKNYGKAMSQVRAGLEKWTRFLNPYHRINSVVTRNIEELKQLDLDIEKDRRLVQLTENNFQDFETNWELVSDKYNGAIGLTFGLRSMLPILAESFINLIIFILSKPEIKQNERLFQNTIRQQIDIRVQSLHLNCIGFTKPIDYTDKVCKKFHTLMNERNDILHGNVEIKKLIIGDVYFNKKVPIFFEYEDFWQKAMGISLNSVRFNNILDDHSTVTKFIEHVLHHLTTELSEQVKHIMGNCELGYNKETGRLGALFSDQIADFRLSPKKG